MKIAIVSADARGRVDNTVMNGLLAFLPSIVSAADADVILTPVSWYADFQFNTELLKVRKPICVVDFVEFCWDWDQEKSNLFGTGMTRAYGHLASDEYAKLDDWVRDHPPVLQFKRELLARDRTHRVRPIGFPCRIPAPPIQTRAEFAARPIEVFSSWGLSHPSRQRLHGDIFRNAHEKGIHVIDSWEDDHKWERRNWVSIYSPYWRRKLMDEVMRWQGRAKISVSLPGAGIVCFRSAEAPVNSIMALHNDNLAWPHKWQHGINCFRLAPGHEFSCLEAIARSTEPDQLYDIYRASQETIDRYRERMAREYMVSAIHECL